MIQKTSLYSSQRINTKSYSVSFAKGKTTFFSDFDRTFFPATPKYIKNLQNAGQAPHLTQYFQGFDDFLGRTRDKLTFIITTGRNLPEFEYFTRLIRDKGFKMPLPDKLIVKNGSDEHFKVGSDEIFYNGGDFPFSHLSVSTQKRDAIKALTGWDGDKIKEHVRSILKGYNFEIKEPPTTNSPEDYGHLSIFHSFRDDFDPYNPYHSSRSPWVASLRQDGAIKMHIGFPKDMEVVSERNAAKYDIQGRIHKFLNDGGVSYFSDFNPHDWEYGNHPCITILPKIDGDPLTKLYDTQVAVKKAVAEDDLVVVAGDSSNDFEMLNPARYLTEFMSADVLKHKDNPQKIIVEMDKNPEFAQKFRELPFIGIVVKNKEHSDARLNDLATFYGDGKYKKIIVAEEGQLAEGVEQAIKLHSEQKSVKP